VATLQTGVPQVVTYGPDGVSSPRALGQLGHVTALKYSTALPGGPAQLSCVLQQPPTTRPDALNTGRRVDLLLGAATPWSGKLAEPVPATTGLTLTATGMGGLGTDYDAIYSGTWPGSVPDDPVNQAISRGLPWVNPGIGSPSGMWLGQAVDSGAQDIATLMNLLCSNGGLTWYVDSTSGKNVLSVFSLPTTPNRILVATNPAPRTLGGDINVIWLRYMVTADDPVAGTPAVYTNAVALNQASIDRHGRMEVYTDLSSAGVMTNSAAVAVGQAVLQRYVRASFAGGFVVQPGQILTTGGQPVNLATEQAGNVYRLILTDFGYGGEISAKTISFLSGACEFDVDSGLLTVTPFGALNASLTGLLTQAVANIVPHTAIV
jgi:hypothetical protein